MRVVKEAEERRNEILDVAAELFGTKGFECTSTKDILERVGIARGTLYYHFKSKEDILDGVIKRMIGERMDAAERVVNQRELPLLERLTKAILALNVNNKIGDEVMEQVHRPQNALMHQKMQEELLSGINPILTKLLKEGMAQGIFQTEYPEETIEMIMLYANTMFDDLMEQTLEQKKRRRKAFIYNIEKLFGAERGSMLQAIMQIFAETSEEL